MTFWDNDHTANSARLSLTLEKNKCRRVSKPCAGKRDLTVLSGDSSKSGGRRSLLITKSYTRHGPGIRGLIMCFQ